MRSNPYTYISSALIIIAVSLGIAYAVLPKEELYGSTLYFILDIFFIISLFCGFATFSCLNRSKEYSPLARLIAVILGSVIVLWSISAIFVIWFSGIEGLFIY